MILALNAKDILYLRVKFVAKSMWIVLGLKPDVCYGRSVTNHLTSGVDIGNILVLFFVNY
jgi:hypothetical protein